jgi:oxygen-dependent protoporphyrinogen oxidase
MSSIAPSTHAISHDAHNAGRGLRVAIIGGGITGLAGAQRLISRSSNVQVTLFEASKRLGGIIRTEQADGFLMELGPDSFITNKPAGLQLCREIGFESQLVSTDSRYRRSLVLHNGRPQNVPDGFMLMAPAKPWAIMTTPVLSFFGKLRLLREAFVARKASMDDESLGSFVRRRFGSEALDRLVQPLVGGIYTSDPEKLSLLATMPRFLEMERDYGSVIKGTLAQQKADAARGAGKDAKRAASGSGARYGLFASAANGLSDLISALENVLKASGRVSFRLGTSVRSVQQETSDSARWKVETSPAKVTNAAAPAQVEEFDALVITLPTHAAARLLNQAPMQPLVRLLQGIEYASSAIVVSGHQLSDFAHPMDAFGIVIPARENRKILAVSFSSRKFLNRAPDGQILLRTFVGGAMQPELLQMDNDALIATVNAELKDIFGMSREPMFSEVVRYENAMPQYHVGHLDRVAQIESAQSHFPGLQLAGSAYHGVGIPDSIASGQSAADRILA